MRRRLRWITHHLRDYWPGNWQIKHRLVTAGVALSVLSLATPFYMRSKLASLSDTYNWTTSNWKTLDRIHQFTHLLTDSESKLRAYATSGDRAWLTTIDQNSQIMGELLVELQKAAADKSTRSALLKEASTIHQHWVSDIIYKYTRKDTVLSRDKFARALISEPLAFRMHSLLTDVENDIQDNNIIANLAVLKASKQALLVVTYGGTAFFIGFAALMLSFWFTLMPALNSLLGAAKELKKGNLDHRVYLTGGSETSQIGRAFNEMAVSLKAQNEKLKELNRMKTDFVSTVSHELRTPLTAIKGSIGLILGNVTGPIPEETAQMLKITQKNTDRLIRLINEILDVAKIEAGAIQMRFDKYSLIDTMNRAIIGLEAFAQTQGIKILWEKPQASPLVVIDRDRIEQVITNLMSNAIKFTDPGGTVTARCEWESDRVIVQVTDTGHGIPEEFLERIFQKFQQAESSANKAKEGTGLGLTIAKAIVEEHGGSIWVSSTVGSGSTFSFSLPWNGTEYVESKKPTSNALQLKNKKLILLVDNEPDFTTVIKKLLEHEGYEVQACNSGKAALEIAAKIKPDLIILDILMPDMDGFTVRKLLSESSETKSIPIVFVTVSPEMQKDAYGEPVVQVIPKPIVADDFKAWLKTFFSARQLNSPKKAA